MSTFEQRLIHVLAIAFGIAIGTLTLIACDGTEAPQPPAAEAVTSVPTVNPAPAQVTAAPSLTPIPTSALPPSAEPTAETALESLPSPTPTPSKAVPPSSTSEPSLTPTASPTHTLPPSATTTPPPTVRTRPSPTVKPTPYGFALGIHYRYPQRYTSQGRQSQISDLSVLEDLQAPQQSLAQLQEIYRWLKDAFSSYSGGGQTIGVVTVDELLEKRSLGGCHDYGLMYAAVARELGYPALMVRTNSIAWVERFQNGNPSPHVGHVFVEVYLDDKWILIDSTNGWYVDEDYDPADPVIPLTGHIAGSEDEPHGFYVERKGIDVWSFGIHSPQESTQAMDEFARQLDLNTITYPDYTFQRFSR